MYTCLCRQILEPDQELLSAQKLRFPRTPYIRYNIRVKIEMRHFSGRPHNSWNLDNAIHSRLGLFTGARVSIPGKTYSHSVSPSTRTVYHREPTASRTERQKQCYPHTIAGLCQHRFSIGAITPIGHLIFLSRPFHIFCFAIRRCKRRRWWRSSPCFFQSSSVVVVGVHSLRNNLGTYCDPVGDSQLRSAATHTTPTVLAVAGG